MTEFGEVEQGNSMLSRRLATTKQPRCEGVYAAIVSVTKLYLKTAQMSHFVCKVPTCMSQTHYLWLPIHFYEVIQNSAYMKQLFL